MAPKRTVAKPATEPPAAKVAKMASQKTEKAAPKEKAPKKEAAPKEKAPKKEAAPKEKAVKEKAPKEKAVKEEKTPKEKAVKEEKAPKEKAAKPAAKAKAAAKGATSVDVTEFGEVLLETCKVLMTVCQTSQFEDEDAQTVTTTENFAVHGAGVLALLPEDARLPMMKIALHYREELDKEFDMYDGMDDDEEEEDDEVEGEEEAKEGEAAAVASGIVVKDAEAEEEEGEEDDEDDEAHFDVMVPQQFFWLKECFTEAEAAELVKSAKEGGALCKAIEAALESVETAEEEEEEEGEEDDEEEEGEEEDEAEEDEEEDEWGENAPWKTA